jgi:hypothetical protein
MRHEWRIFAILAAIGVVVLAVVLSPDEVRWIRTEVPFANFGMGWLELRSQGINATHVALFFLAALVLALALPGASLPRVGLVAMLAMAVIASLSEALQWLIPGRTPRLADVRDDLIGAVLGTLVGLVVRAAWRRWSARGR